MPLINNNYLPKFNLKMNNQSLCLHFSELLLQCIPLFEKWPIFFLKYQNIISQLKKSLNIPKAIPTSQEILNSLIFLKNIQTPPRELAIKSFCIKKKSFLILVITVFEVFSHKSLENFVIFIVFDLKF